MQTELKSLIPFRLIIAIDGHAACGKSTLAKAMAKALNYRYVDSGAMYRAVTLFFLNNSVDLQNEDAISSALQKIKIDFSWIDGKNHTFLNSKDVENDIRSHRVSQNVSPVAAIPLVRRKLVEQQQEMGKMKGIVMDGRDIGTVVFPNADLKLFVTADINVRADRRKLEMANSGVDISIEEVKKNLQQRDEFDTNRADSPLTRADDAFILDTSNLTPEQQLEEAIHILYDKMVD